MSLLLHVVWKDFLRLRGWLALWAVLLAGEVGLGWLVRSVEWTHWDWTQLTTAAGFLAGVDTLIVFPLTLLLVQEDPPTGTQQFWVTRPMSGMRLLAAKWLGVVLIFGGVPVLVALPWWLSCGFGVRELAWAVAETIGLNMLVALPAVLVAALTDSLQRAFLWTLVMLAAWASGTALWAFFVPQRAGTGHMELAWSRTWIALVALALGAVGAIVVQFLTRRFLRSLAIFGGGLALAVVIAGWWPERWSSETKMAEANAERAASMTLEFTRAIFRAEPRNGGRDGYMDVEMLAHGVPPDRFLEGIDGSIHYWRWSGGPTLSRDGWVSVPYGVNESFPMRAAFGLNDEQKDEETERVLLKSWQEMRDSVEEQERRKQLGLAPLPPLPPAPPPKSSNRRLTAGLTVPRSLAARMRTDPPVYEAHEWLRLLRPEVWFETPLRVSGWQSFGAHRMRVTSLGRFAAKDAPRRLADEVRVTLVETRPTTWLDDWAIIYFPRSQWQLEWRLLQQEAFPYGVNRRLGQLEALRMAGAERVRIRSVQMLWRTVRVTVPKISRGGKWVDWQPSWRDGATLALVGFSEEARFERTVKVERFEPTQ